MSLENIKILVDIIQSLATTAGVVIAGIWSFYVFILGRGFAPNVQSDIELKGTVCLKRGEAAIVTITVKNIGKTRILKKKCYVVIEPLRDSPKDSPALSRTDDFSNCGDSRTNSILDDLVYLEPEESISEDALFTLNELRLFKVKVIFVDRNNKGWISSAILNAQPDKNDPSGD